MSKGSQVRADGSASSRAGMSRRAFLATGGMALLGTMAFAGPCYGGGLLGGLIDAITKGPGVQVKASTNDYTWDELAAIADEISASGSADAALQVAEKYNLCTSNGKLDGTQTKSVALTDGTQTLVQIAGFCHDDRSDGSGKAGITFIFSNVVAGHAMNSSGTNLGGWEACEMRSWLASDFAALLPSDLAKDIVTVDKLTNNTGETSDISSVIATQDAVWLFSSTELCGSISWYGDSQDAVLSAEGTEYQLFSDNGVSSNGSNAILMKNYLSADYAAGIQGGSCSWWVRSAFPGGSSEFGGVGVDGRPYASGVSSDANGVVPGFCVGSGDGAVATAAVTSGSGAIAAASTSSVSVSVKSSANDYTWDELAAIADQISASGSANFAIQVAQKYNLCTPDGHLDGTQTKSVTLSDGTQAEVQIAGFYHDDKSDGSGKAGITFIFKDAIAQRVMNASDTNFGGWEACEMRSWLASDIVAMLPSDLVADIATVDKLSNNVGNTSDVSSVTMTHDDVWLLSFAEMSGITRWYGDSHDDVLKAEGSEYQLFCEYGVADLGDDYPILIKSYQDSICDWWLRTASPSSSDCFYHVLSSGRPRLGTNASAAIGVVPGFCI